MRYFLDTEFNEEVDPVGLISIGMVADDGREFYAVNNLYMPSDTFESESCNDWVKRNVLPKLFAHLPQDETVKFPIMTVEKIRDGLKDFVGNDPFPEFWAYYGAYDWYLTCRLFGRFDQQPKAWAKAGNICFDVKQFAKHYGVQKLLKKLEPEHNALIDARWTKTAFDFVVALRDKKLTPEQIQETWP